MEHGIFDPDILFTLIRLDELGINPDSPYSSEHGLDAKSDVYRRYQRALVHEKCHYFTTLSSTLFVRRAVAKHELAWQLSHPQIASQSPLVALDSPPENVLFWLYEFCADRIYFDNLTQGKELDSNRQVEYLIRREGICTILNHFGWSPEELSDLYRRPSFKSLRTTALAEGLAKSQEYLVLSKWDVSPDDIESEHLDLANDFFSDNTVYTAAIDFFRNYFLSVAFYECLPVFAAFAEAALSPPVRTDGGWPTIPSPEFGLFECLPQTRFEFLCEHFRDRTDIFKMSRGELMRAIEQAFETHQWQTPLQTATLMLSRLSNPSLNQLENRAVEEYGHSPPSAVVPDEYEDIGKWIMGIRALRWKDTVAMAEAKTYDPYTAAPPYNLGLFECYHIAARNVIDSSDRTMMQLAYALLHLKLPSAIAEYRIFGNREGCVVGCIDRASLARRQFADAAKSHNEACQCIPADGLQATPSNMCPYGILLSASLGWEFND